MQLMCNTHKSEVYMFRRFWTEGKRSKTKQQVPAGWTWYAYLAFQKKNANVLLEMVVKNTFGGCHCVSSMKTQHIPNAEKFSKFIFFCLIFFLGRFFFGLFNVLTVYAKISGEIEFDTEIANQKSNWSSGTVHCSFCDGVIAAVFFGKTF